MRNSKFPIVEALWAGSLDVLVVRTEDGLVWSLNPNTTSSVPIPLAPDLRCEEVLDASGQAVLMNCGYHGWSYIRISMDDEGRCVPNGQPTKIAVDTSTGCRAVWLEFPYLLIRVDLGERGYEFKRVNVTDGAIAPLVQSDGEAARSTRGGFLLDRTRRSVALCNGFEVPLFDLVSLRQTGCVYPRIAVFSMHEAVYRAEDASILRASYEGLYRLRVGECGNSLSIENPTLFNCSLLGFSQSLHTYILLNHAADRIGVMRESLPPIKWWNQDAGGIDIPSDHTTVSLNDKGDRVLLLRRNKSIEVHALGTSVTHA